MGGLNLNTIRKQQMHSSKLKAWTYRGTSDFNPFNPTNVLAGDNWVSVGGTVLHEDLIIHSGDMILALIDWPGVLSMDSVFENKWKIIRNSGSVGSKLIAESIFVIDGGNYNMHTKRLTIYTFPHDFFKIGDNVNIKVNNASYNHVKAFEIDYGSHEVIWKPNQGKAGFDLEEGDLIEIEVFRQ